MTPDINELSRLTEQLSGSPLSLANKHLQSRLELLTKPPYKEGSDGIPLLKLTDVLDISLLQKLQDQFSATYNIASVIYDEHGVPITRPSNFSRFCMLLRTSAKGVARCERSKERHYELTIERGGACLDVCQNFHELLDGSVPFVINGRRVGTWCAGQRAVKELKEKRVRKYAKEIGVNPDDLWEYAQELSHGSKEDYQKVIDFLDLMCQTLAVMGLQNIQQAQAISKYRFIEIKYQTLLDDTKKLYCK